MYDILQFWIMCVYLIIYILNKITYSIHAVFSVYESPVAELLRCSEVFLKEKKTDKNLIP
jgi:hypothetical protein